MASKQKQLIDTETQRFQSLGNNLADTIRASINQKEPKHNWIKITLVIIAIIGAVIAVRNLVKEDIDKSKKETEKTIQTFRNEVKEDIKDIKEDIKEVKKQITAMGKEYDKRIETRENLALMMKDITREEILIFFKNNKLK